MLTTIFHNNEIWDQFTDPEESRQAREPIPIYAFAYKENTNTWWCWYHSWNRLNETALEHLPPVCLAFMLLQETT